MTDVAVVMLVPYEQDVYNLRGLCRGSGDTLITCRDTDLRGVRTKRLIVFPFPFGGSLRDEDRYGHLRQLAFTRLDLDGVLVVV